MPELQGAIEVRGPSFFSERESWSVACGETDEQALIFFY